MKGAAQQTSGTCFTFQVSAVEAERGEGCSRGNVFSQEDRLLRCLRAEKRAHISSIHGPRLLGSRSDLLEQRSPLILPGAVARIASNYTRFVFIPVAYFPLATELDGCMEGVHLPLVGAVSGEDGLILLIMQKGSCSQTEKHESFFHHGLKQPQRW